DRETAQSFYEQAQRAERARQKVMVSTRPEVEGQTVGHVAEQSTTLVESSFAARAEARRRSGAPPALRTRDNRIVVEPKKPANQSTTPPEFRRPAQENEEPTVAAPQSDRPPNQNEPQLKTRPQQRQPTQQSPDSQQQPPPQQQ